jgi:hypothetical protein
MPHDKIPYNLFMPGLGETYFRINQFEKGEAIYAKLLDISDRYLAYYATFRQKDKSRIMDEVTYHLRIIGSTSQVAREYNQTELLSTAEKLFDKYSSEFSVF